MGGSEISPQSGRGPPPVSRAFSTISSSGLAVKAWISLPGIMTNLPVRFAALQLFPRMITSFIIDYLGGQARSTLPGHLVTCPRWRLSAQVDCCPMAFLNPGAFLITKRIFSTLPGPRYRPTCSFAASFIWLSPLSFAWRGGCRSILPGG